MATITATREDVNGQLCAYYEYVTEDRYGACGDYAFIDADAPVKTIQEEAHSFFGRSTHVSVNSAWAIWEEIELYNFPKVRHARFVDADSFMKIVAAHVEI